MRTLARLSFFVVSAFSLAGVTAATALRAAEAAAWRPVAEVIKLPAGWTLGACGAVAVNSRGELFVFHRGEHPLLVFDAKGNYLRSWGDGLIGSAHGLRIDSHDDVWVTDTGNHRVHKFDAQGKLLMSLGTGKASDALDSFNKPTDVAFGPKGEFYITDGYGNSRVMKFSPSGALLQSWGTPGTGPSQFQTVHSIVIDKAGRLLVGDRENDRIQIFDTDGKLLDIWTGYAPYGLALDGDGKLFVADGRAHRVFEVDAKGKIVATIGKQGAAAGEFDLPHMMTFDAAGDLIVTEITNKRIQKFTKR